MPAWQDGEESDKRGVDNGSGGLLMPDTIDLHVRRFPLACGSVSEWTLWSRVSTAGAYSSAS